MLRKQPLWLDGRQPLHKGRIAGHFEIDCSRYRGCFGSDGGLRGEETLEPLHRLLALAIRTVRGQAQLSVIDIADAAAIALHDSQQVRANVSERVVRGIYVENVGRIYLAQKRVVSMPGLQQCSRFYFFCLVQSLVQKHNC